MGLRGPGDGDSSATRARVAAARSATRQARTATVPVLVGSLRCGHISDPATALRQLATASRAAVVKSAAGGAQAFELVPASAAAANLDVTLRLAGLDQSNIAKACLQPPQALPARPTTSQVAVLKARLRETRG
jgi:hypothetical protein